MRAYTRSGYDWSTRYWPITLTASVMPLRFSGRAQIARVRRIVAPEQAVAEAGDAEGYNDR